jgi:GT2 family glycosyltransferase
MPKTSVIVLTYNSARYIKNNLETIHKFNKDSNIEIIVVDNNSSDDTLKIVKGLKFKVKIIQTGANIGFAAGINSGAEEASGEFLLFVNPDTQWIGGTINDMISVFDTYREVGIVGGKLVGKDGKAELSCGNFFGPIPSIAVALGLDGKMGVRFSPEKIRKVDFVSGGFMMVRRMLFNKLSGFDRNLFMYVEDMEFCYRAKQAGYFTYFTPEVEIIHESHGSSNRGFAIANIHKGIFYFHKKHGTKFSYSIVRTLFTGKALALVIMGKILNNKTLADTYLKALKI